MYTAREMGSREHQNQHPHDHVGTNNNNNGSSKGGGPPQGCRQSSTRWTPTAEQIRILKDLYYNYGVRSPNAEQIQRISARLRQFGKIEGKNVFYWFQNHKARERQKKRFISDPFHAPGLPPPSAHHSTRLGGGVEQMPNYGYGSVTVEKKFGECSISAGSGSSSAGGLPVQSFGWVAMEPCYPSSSCCAMFGGRNPFSSKTVRRYRQEEGEEEEEEDEEAGGKDGDGQEIETLRLFPMGDEGHKGSFCSSNSPGPTDSDGHDNYSGSGGGRGSYKEDITIMAKPRASSLELSLNLSSCPGESPASF